MVKKGSRKGTDHTHTPESSMTRVPGVWAPGPPNIRRHGEEGILMSELKRRPNEIAFRLLGTEGATHNGRGPHYPRQLCVHKHSNQKLVKLTCEPSELTNPLSWKQGQTM